MKQALALCMWSRQQLYVLKIQNTTVKTGNHHSNTHTHTHTPTHTHTHTHTLWVKNNQRRWATHSKSQWKRGHVGWRGKRKERKERCSPWECSSITGRLRPALTHCHSDATSTPARKGHLALHCSASNTKHTHCICAFTKMQMDTLPSVVLSLTSHCCCHANTNKHRYSQTYCTASVRGR